MSNLTIGGAGASTGVDIREQSSVALGGAAEIAEQKLRDIARAVQTANQTVTEIASYYASARRVIDGSTIEGDDTNISKALEYLKQNGYLYSVLDGANPLSSDDKKTILGDLLTLKDNASSISQNTFSDFQRATQQLQVLNTEQSAIEKTLADKLADVIRNWS